MSKDVCVKDDVCLQDGGHLKRQTHQLLAWTLTQSKGDRGVTGVRQEQVGKGGIVHACNAKVEGRTHVRCRLPDGYWEKDADLDSPVPEYTWAAGSSVVEMFKDLLKLASRCSEFSLAVDRTVNYRTGLWS